MRPLRPSTAYDSDRLAAGLSGVCHAHDGNGVVRDGKQRGRFYVCMGRELATILPVDDLKHGNYNRAYWACANRDINRALRGKINLANIG